VDEILVYLYCTKHKATEEVCVQSTLFCAMLQLEETLVKIDDSIFPQTFEIDYIKVYQ
jgi:hypothetical protein